MISLVFIFNRVTTYSKREKSLMRTRLCTHYADESEVNFRPISSGNTEFEPIKTKCHIFL